MTTNRLPQSLGISIRGFLHPRSHKAVAKKSGKDVARGCRRLRLRRPAFEDDHLLNGLSNLLEYGSPAIGTLNHWATSVPVGIDGLFISGQ